MLPLTLLPSPLLAKECHIDGNIVLTPDFKISYRNYCTDQGDISSLVAYYQKKCDESEILLSEFRTRQANGDKTAKKFVDYHRYAVDYFCGLTEQKIKASARRTQICSQFSLSGSECGRASLDSRVVINPQHAGNKHSKTDSYNHCLTHSVDTQAGSVIVSARNHCETELFITVCLDIQDRDSQPPARLDKAITSRGQQTFVFPGVNQSPYEYLVGWCQSDTNNCNIACE
ncbi:MAG: hypothetical protein CSA50_04405 [Gammaproteobacteria bacterium]|nr:MAG: hypothetical protein CSA50_04405 [Gammaproteobacteria bacterium]